MTGPLKVDIGSATECGTRYGSLNQDYAVVQEFYAPGETPKGHEQIWIASVCDGHGVLGDKAAMFAGKGLARYLYSSSLRGRNLAEAPPEELTGCMRAAFNKGQQAAVSLYDSPPKTINYPTNGMKHMASYNLCQVDGGVYAYKSCSNGKEPEKLLECGCTCTAAVVQGHTVCLAHVGDSLAVLGSDTGERYTGRVLTVRDHGLNQEEAARIQQLGCPGVKLLPDGYLAIMTGPYHGCELSVTRALGHKYLEGYGVASEPHITCFNIAENECCLIVASDGVWDVMSADEAVTRVMECVAEGKTAAQAAKHLVEEAVMLALDGPSQEADNTTAVVVVFH